MKTKFVATVMALAFVYIGASTARAQTGAHIMVTPADLKWTDVPSLPPGAKIAVIEGALAEALPFTFRLRLPSGTKSPLTGTRRSST